MRRSSPVVPDAIRAGGQREGRFGAGRSAGGALGDGAAVRAADPAGSGARPAAAVRGGRAARCGSSRQVAGRCDGTGIAYRPSMTMKSAAGAQGDGSLWSASTRARWRRSRSAAAASSRSRPASSAKSRTSSAVHSLRACPKWARNIAVHISLPRPWAAAWASSSWAWSVGPEGPLQRVVGVQPLRVGAVSSIEGSRASRRSRRASRPSETAGAGVTPSRGRSGWSWKEAVDHLHVCRRVRNDPAPRWSRLSISPQYGQTMSAQSSIFMVVPLTDHLLSVRNLTLH